MSLISFEATFSIDNHWIKDWTLECIESLDQLSSLVTYVLHDTDLTSPQTSFDLAEVRVYIRVSRHGARNLRSDQTSIVCVSHVKNLMYGSSPEQLRDCSWLVFSRPKRGILK